MLCFSKYFVVYQYKKLIIYPPQFLANEYNITWKVDTSANYKFFHKYNSIVVPDYQNDEVPIRYPFADIFIYAYNEDHDLLTYTNQWKDLVPGKGFNASFKWPNGTVLTAFGNFEMSSCASLSNDL